MAMPPVDLWALADLRTPWCLRVAATLRVAELIAGGRTAIGELAAAAGCDREALHAVLTHLTRVGVFAEPEPGRFALNETAEALLDPGMHLGLDLRGIGHRMTEIWSTLPAFVRTGEPAYQARFGRTFWEDLAADPELRSTFDALMGPAGHGAPDARFEVTGGWEAVRTVVDVGGGTGAFLVALLRLHPRLRGTLVDLPATVARADFGDVADRARAVGQSFFDPLPPGADLYLLRKVLNDWPDGEATAILRRCAEGAGRVILLGAVEERDLTVEMLLAGGRHRDLAALTALVEGAGLEVAAVHDRTVACRLANGRLA
jgi:hypothetical protein